VNPFLKAALLTLVVVALALAMAAQLDAVRASELRNSIDGALFQNQERQVALHFGRVMANDTAAQCTYLARMRAKQLNDTYPLALKIQDYEKNNLFNREYENIKTTYFLGVSDSYISAFEQQQACGGDEIPVLLIYREKTDCPECRAQNQVLSGLVAARCADVRIYSLPYDYPLMPLQMLADRYNVTDASRAPVTIIGDKIRLEGLRGEDELVAALISSGAACGPKKS
jgi:hypothetical protein